MNAEDQTVTIPRKESATTDSAEPTAVWPIVEDTLDTIGADELTYDAARDALGSSDGCVVLATYLQSETEHVQEADRRFKVPLVVLAAQRARDDGRAEAIYDPGSEALYFETDEEDYAFDVGDAWMVNWTAVADEEIDGYVYDGGEHGPYALDRLMSYLEVDASDYLLDDDENDDDGPQHFSRV